MFSLENRVFALSILYQHVAVRRRSRLLGPGWKKYGYGEIMEINPFSRARRKASNGAIIKILFVFMTFITRNDHRTS